MCVSVLSQVQLFATPGTVAHQVPLSMGFSRQEYWNGLPFPPPGDLPKPRDGALVSCTSCIGRQFLYHWATWEAPTAGLDFAWLPVAMAHLSSNIRKSLYLSCISAQKFSSQFNIVPGYSFLRSYLEVQNLRTAQAYIYNFFSVALSVTHAVVTFWHNLWNSVFFSISNRESDLVHGIVLILPAYILPSFVLFFRSFTTVLILLSISYSDLLKY